MELQVKKLGNAQLGIIVLALGSGLVHLGLSLSLGFDIVFFLNFLGYFSLVAAYFLKLPIVKDYRPLVRWAFMAFVVATIVAWLFIGDHSWWVGIVTKLGELGLLVLLWFDKP